MRGATVHVWFISCVVWKTLLFVIKVVKVQFRGPERLKKKGTLFQEESYQPSFFRLSLTNWWYNSNEWTRFMSILRSFSLLMKPNDMTTIASIFAKQHMHYNVWLADRSRASSLWWIATYDWWRAPVHLYCDVMITRPSKHDPLADLSKATYHVNGRKFDPKTQCKCDG